MISQILEKVGRGTLSAMEMERFKAWGDTTESDSAFVSGIQSGKSDISANIIDARELRSFTRPSHTVNMDWSGTLDVPNNDWTQVTGFSATVGGTRKGASSEYFEFSALGGDDRITVLKQPARLYIVGLQFWDINSTGERNWTVEHYDKDNNYMGFFHMGTVAAEGYTRALSARAPAFRDVSDRNVGDYFKVFVYQNSGGNLDLTVSSLMFGVLE